MIMKLIKLLLPTTLVLFCSVIAYAHDFEVNGIYYNYLDGNEVEVTYRGSSFGSYQNEYSGSVNIPDTITHKGTIYTVTKISADAFRECLDLTSIKISNSVTRIGSHAFMYCIALTSITIPNSVTSIGYRAFYEIGIYKDESKWENGLLYIDNCLIYAKKDMSETYHIKEGTRLIADQVFCGFSSLTSVTIPNSVTNIGFAAFDDCSSLTSATIPNSVTTIEKSTFARCSSLTSITIGESVTNIEKFAFDGCSSLTSITWNAKNCTHFDYNYQGPFYNSRLQITNFTYGDSVEHIPGYICYEMKKLTSITIPNSVTTIGDNAFSYCNSLTLMIIGAGVLSIGAGNQSHPTKVIWLPNTPPSGCKNLAGTINYIPNNQYSLTNAYIYPFLSSMFETDGVKYIPISPSDRTCDVIDCIYDSTNLQIAIDSTVIFQGVEMKTKNIMPYAFYKNDFIREVSLGNSGNIERFAFGNCSNLQTATISNTGTIESDAFKGCSSLTTAGLGDSIKALGDNAFYQCSSLQAITIPNSVGSVGKYCFSGCSNMITAVIGDGLATIKDYTFQHCSALESLIIGNHVTTIETYAFEKCSSLPNIIIPQSVRSIDNNAFKGCASLADVIIEDRSTKLELGSNGSSPLFADCPLDSVYIGGKITYNTSKNSGYSPFYRNTSLRTITITDQEEQIYENEFYGCTNLKNVTIGHGIKNIGERAFSGCSSLDKFSFGSNVESIGAEAFSDCVNMTQIISSASIPPVCGTQALDDINKWSCVLKVPQNYKAAYQTAEQWKEFFFIEDVVEVKKFAVIYMVDNETFAIDSLSVGEVIITIEEPTKEGYTFSGWNEVPEIMPAEDIVIDGYFSVNYYALKYTVDDEPYAVDSVAYGAVIELREKPKRDDYEFIGWSEAPETMPAHDIEVYGNFIFTSVTDVQVDPEQSQKVTEDNQLFIILPNGKKYNAMGQEL